MIKKRSIMIAGHATSISLEKEFWDEVKRIANEENTSIPHLIEKIDENRETNLSSAIRLYVLKTIKNPNS